MLPLKGVLVLLVQFSILHEHLEKASRFVIDFDFFGADPCFAFKLLGGHEEVVDKAFTRWQTRINDSLRGINGKTQTLEDVFIIIQDSYQAAREWENIVERFRRP